MTLNPNINRTHPRNLNIIYLSWEDLDGGHGAIKAMRSTLRDLSSRGHRCILAGPMSSDFVEQHRSQPKSRQRRGGMPVWVIRAENLEYITFRSGWFQKIYFFFLRSLTRFTKNATVEDRVFHRFLSRFFSRVVAEETGKKRLDLILTDGHPTTVLAIDECPLPKMAVLQVPLFIPFGPCAPKNPPSRLIESYRKFNAYLTFYDYAKKLIEDELGVKVFKFPVPPSMFGTPKTYDNATSGYVVMINPCDYKGIDIFLAIAKEMPDVSFAAVPGWGAESAEFEEIKKTSNIAIIPFQKDVEELYRQTRVLLVPSLWPEFFGLVVIEAMLRGIPVIASDYAGLRESKLGVDYLIPIKPIVFFNGPTEIGIPDQDIQPWKNALNKLLTDAEHYRRVSSESIKAAKAYIQKASTAISDIEAVFQNFIAGPVCQIKKTL